MTENIFQRQSLAGPGKGLGLFAGQPSGQTVAAAAEAGWHLLHEDVSLPVAVLRASRVEHNLQWMQTFIDRYGVKLAPHGKTTMSPALFQRQLAHGAWGITLATAPQVQAAVAYGVQRVLMANQLVGRANMAIIAGLQAADPAFDFYCLVDSPSNIDALGTYFQERGQQLKLLLELGVDGARTGVRDGVQQEAVLDAIARWSGTLILAGVELYEGVLSNEADIRAFLRRARDAAEGIEAAGGFEDLKGSTTARPILSGAGSAWYDVVAEVFTEKNAAGEVSSRFDVVLRPGCYLTHDVGAYRQANERIHTHNPIAREMGRSLLPALQVWAYVQSLPELGKAIIGMGKRDAAFDAGFPLPSLHYRPANAALPMSSPVMHAVFADGAAAAVAVSAEAAVATPVSAPGDWRITAMMDQHAFMSIPADADLQVGDMIAFDISHPCLTFDKWRQLLLVDDDYRVTDVVTTFF